MAILWVVRLCVRIIFSQPMMKFFRVSATKVWVKAVAKPVILSYLTVICEARVSRLARKTLFFSKKLEKHSGTIWYLIRHCNASLLI